MSRPRESVAAALAAALVVVAGVSAKGTGKATLAIDPASVVLGSTFTLSGCGYPSPTSLSFRVVGPDEKYFTAGEPLTDSCFEETWTAWWPEAGAYQITSYYRDKRGAARKVAVVKFTVTIPAG